MKRFVAFVLFAALPMFSLAIVDEVFDAFENRTFANYQSSTPFVDDGKEHKPVWCSVRRPGHPDEWCKDAYEFDALVEKYFGIGR